jgi:hypothetical protein
MTLRPPKSLAPSNRTGNPFQQLETEILEEAVTALGHYGRAAEAALAKLDKAEAAEREKSLQAAAEAVWVYLIQREQCGLTDHRYIIREMSIPKPVLNRMGAMKRK